MSPFKNPLRKITVFTSVFLMFSAILSTQVLAQASSASATARATAWIVSALAVEQERDLAFGEISTSSVPGSVTVSPLGNVTSSGGISQLGGQTGAKFTVQGGEWRSVSISLPDTTTLTSDGNTMTVNNFTSDKGTQAQLASDGTLNIRVGATLAVGANQPFGEYVGEFAIMVSYN